jgi:hypothetical protein
MNQLPLPEYSITAVSPAATVMLALVMSASEALCVSTAPELANSIL